MENKQFDQANLTIGDQKLISELVMFLKENVVVFGKLNKTENFHNIIITSCMILIAEIIFYTAEDLKKIEDLPYLLNDCLDTFKINIEKIREAFISH